MDDVSEDWAANDPATKRQRPNKGVRLLAANPGPVVAWVSR